ncbi:MAG: sulfatase-like hydrolase/transferase [Bryobacteraceae bacterium]
MNRREAVRLLGLGGGASVLSAQSKKPNFVFLFADDMGWGDAGFNGRRDWSTANLDRLASQGTIFERWYSGMPLCAPSRACLLTGRYTIHHGVRNNGTDIPASEVTIAEALKPLGYKTALFGKWHRGNLPGGGFTHPLDQGFDETFGYLDARHAWEHFPKELYRGKEKIPVQGYSCDLLANEAIRFIKENREHPFFLYVPFIEPHFNIEAPPENVAKYKGKFAEKNPAEPYNARYAGMIDRLDAAIGRIVRSLDELGLGKDTLVFFTSDNGATFEARNQGASAFHDSNHPYGGQKRSLEEGGIREPSFARWPGRIPAGKRNSDPMHMTDILPTFLAAGGGAPDPAWKVDGIDLFEVWTGKAKMADRTLFWEWQVSGYDMCAAMRGDFKLLQLGKNKFLYNVRKDPGERRTLAAEYPEIFERLQKELAVWLATGKAKTAN